MCDSNPIADFEPPSPWWQIYEISNGMTRTYPLAYHHHVQVEVSVAGVQQEWGKDYAFNACNGTITFIEPPEVGRQITIMSRSKGKRLVNEDLPVQERDFYNSKNMCNASYIASLEEN